MQSEEFDNRVREAADHHHPAYDEKAWTKMEKLLDTHLPQKKDDRRRIIFFLLFLLLLSGGAWIFLSKPWQHDKQVAVQDKTAQQNVSANTTVNTRTIEDKATLKTTVDNNTITSIDEKRTATLQVPTARQFNTVLQHITGRKQEKTEKNVSAAVKEPGVNNNETALVANNPVLTIDKISTIDQQKKNNESLNNKTSVATNNSAANTVALLPEKNISEKNSDKQKANNDSQNNPEQKLTAVVAATNPVAKKIRSSGSKSNSFFLSLSAGPDVSAAGSDRLGKTKLLVGAGLGYTFHNKFTIRSGFYSARKIYTASPGQYHPPANFWTYYPNLKQVDADCKVYEIPLLLSYNFSHSARQSLFATAGVSSYLMKRETYNYLYKNSAGNLVYRETTLLNTNKHYFSVLTLSGGYKRNINNTFSIMAEPYLKIPMTGIGFGNVKLNGGGVMFSLGIKPFASKKNKPVH